MQGRSSFLRIVPIIIIIFFFVSVMYAQKIETVEGVKIIHNEKPKWGKEAKIELKFIRKIGELEAEDENYQLYNPVDVAKDEKENIYILEMGDHCVKKFNSAGKFISVFGRKGQGPGEFIYPTNISVDLNDNIYVVESGNHRIQKFTNSGDILGTFRAASYPLSLRILKNSSLIINHLPFPFGGESSTQKDEKFKLISIVDNENNTIKKFCDRDVYSHWQITNTANYTYIETDRDDNVYVAFQYQNRIEKYTSEGILLFRMDRPLNYKIDHKMTLKSYVIEDRQLKQELPDLTLVTDGIGIDHKNRIWIVCHSEQPDRKDTGMIDSSSFKLGFEIFDNNGILLGKLSYPDHGGEVRIFGNTVYFIESQNEMCIYEYRIIDK